jgi:phage terminase small subunit
MPRISSEAKSGALWRAGIDPPKAPKHLSREAKTIWTSIVQSRPADFFDAGNLPLLEQYCSVVPAQRQTMADLERDPTDYGTIDRLVKFGNFLNAIASKLRLTPQSTTRPESGKNYEREPRRNSLIAGNSAVLPLKRP